LRLAFAFIQFLNKFQKIYPKKQFLDVCYINRDFLSFSLLYRLTALKLRAEIDPKKLNQTKGIDDFRKKVLKNILFTDQTITQGLILAEKRIKQILALKFLQEEDIVKHIGDDHTSIACFWVVLQSALIAWEKKEKIENEKRNSYETYEKLKKINEIFSKSEKHQELLAVELKYIDSLQKKKINEREYERCEHDYLEGLKILISQLEKLPPNSYGLFLKKIFKISNQILEKNFASKIENFNDIKIKLPLSDVENTSKLIELQKNEI
jgi:hypothetical protein